MFDVSTYWSLSGRPRVTAETGRLRARYDTVEARYGFGRVTVTPEGALARIWLVDNERPDVSDVLALHVSTSHEMRLRTAVDVVRVVEDEMDEESYLYPPVDGPDEVPWDGTTEGPVGRPRWLASAQQ